ncbi:MAG: hypothetical protein HY736_15015 [Verrucomicrobia bacterium]|nr:hypothetical protein [Verrucomicrobiota bacterium]
MRRTLLAARTQPGRLAGLARQDDRELLRLFLFELGKHLGAREARGLEIAGAARTAPPALESEY